MSALDVSLVAGIPSFRGIEAADLKQLLTDARSRRYEKGEAIFNQGGDAHSFFLLLDGYVRVSRLTAEGDQIIVRYICSGELFGIAQALGLNKYPANAVAAVDCIVLSWSDNYWNVITKKHPTFATNTYQTVGARLQESQERLVELSTERVEQRVANAVLNLAQQTGRKTDEGILIDFPISRKDISEMTGTTLHTVSRLLSSWEQHGILTSERKRITVLEGHQLAIIAAGDRSK
ncbi:MAG: Crp/Fnr family transcriptional regulator [Sneathiella sp.]|uniref:Crp/Fnr family transcriptional regulator n=1 Tax=Sneathiella sp. TaxID=1964365 RepID=UPI003002A554